MRVFVSWTTHDRRYSIDLVEFLKVIGLNVEEAQIKAAAKKLLEQREMEEESHE